MHHDDTKVGLAAGVIGGLGKYLLQITADASFGEKLFEAAITALICGAAGVGGKEIYSYIKKKIVKRKSKKQVK